MAATYGAVQLPQLGPGTEAFVEALLRRIARCDDVLETAKQFTAETAPDLTPDEFHGLWLCNTCSWLDVDCTPELIRGLCSEEEQRAFLLQLVALAEAREAAGSLSTSTSGMDAVAASLACCNSSVAASTSSSLQGGHGGDTATQPAGLLATHQALQARLLEKWAALLPAPLRVTPADMLASLDLQQRPSQEELDVQLRDLQQRVAALQAAPTSQAGTAEGTEDALQQAAALGQLEASFQKFLAADEEFQQWCDAEVAVWGRLKSGPPQAELGADAEVLLQQQRRLRQVVDSLEAVRQAYLQRPPSSAAAAVRASSDVPSQGDTKAPPEHWVPALMARIQSHSAQLSATLQHLHKLSTARAVAAREA